LGLGPVLQPVEQIGDDAVDAGHGVDHQGDQVCVLGAAPGGGDHRPVEPPFRLEDSGRVGEQYLGLAEEGDAHQPGAGGLRLGGDDRDLLPDQGVDQGRFAGIGGADHGDAAEAAGHDNCSRRAKAASVSASCLDVPSALASPTPLIETFTWKVGAWWGPERATSSYWGGLRSLAAAHSWSADLGWRGTLSPMATRSAQAVRTKPRAASSPP